MDGGQKSDSLLGVVFFWFGDIMTGLSPKRPVHRTWYELYRREDLFTSTYVQWPCTGTPTYGPTGETFRSCKRSRPRRPTLVLEKQTWWPFWKSQLTESLRKHRKGLGSQTQTIQNRIALSFITGCLIVGRTCCLLNIYQFNYLPSQVLSIVNSSSNPLRCLLSVLKTKIITSEQESKIDIYI